MITHHQCALSYESRKHPRLIRSRRYIQDSTATTEGVATNESRLHGSAVTLRGWSEDSIPYVVFAVSCVCVRSRM